MNKKEKLYTEEDIKNILYKFIAEGCPNYPKDERGSWLMWLNKYLKNYKLK